MRFCTGCHQLTEGDPLFCNNCGRTYESRLCPRLHVNPRNAEVCSQCGSRELSRPQPASSAWSRAGLAFLGRLPVFALFAVSIALLAAFLNAALSNQRVQGDLLALLLMVGGAWWLYTQLPSGVRRVAGGAWRTGKRIVRRR